MSLINALYGRERDRFCVTLIRNMLLCLTAEGLGQYVFGSGNRRQLGRHMKSLFIFKEKINE